MSSIVFPAGHTATCLDLTAALEEVSIRDAAIKLKEWFGVGDSQARPEPQEKKASQPAKAEDTPKEPIAVNQPLSFQLRVDPLHEYGKSRGLTQETQERFGAGFCLSKGMFAGRYVVPLHNEAGQLVGYAGRALGDQEPKYLFPSSEKGFHKKYLLFSLHRILAESATSGAVVLVEGFFDCMKVTQAGYPCVGLLGCSLSKEQEELIGKYFPQAILLFDGDDAGRAATDEIAGRLARKVFVKVVEVPLGKQPDQLSPKEISELLGSL